MRTNAVALTATRVGRDALGEALDYVQSERADIVYRTRAKKPYAVLVPVDDEQTVEPIEDLIDARSAKKALAALKRSGEKPILYARVRKDLGRR